MRLTKLKGVPELKRLFGVLVGLAVLGGSAGAGGELARRAAGGAAAYEEALARIDDLESRLEFAAGTGGEAVVYPAEDYGYELTAAAGASVSSVSSIFKRVKNSVVSINVKTSRVTLFGQVFEDEGAGSGIIFKQDGSKIYIVTNYHVIDSAQSVTVSLDDSVRAPAHYIGGDEQSDLAVIYVNKADAETYGFSNYSTASFGDSSKVEVGDAAIAIGNALGEGKSATLGIISALDKEIAVEAAKYTVLQTDAAINPGNSGGALVNANGGVIGINSVKLSAVGVEGMGYAIPANYAMSVVSSIMANGSVGRPYLGIDGVAIGRDEQQYYGFAEQGVYIMKIYADSTAAAIGLKTRDIITSFNGVAVTTMNQLTKAIAATKAGASVTITVLRDNSAAVTLTGVMRTVPSATSF
jgi:serine protease Do